MNMSINHCPMLNPYPVWAFPEVVRIAIEELSTNTRAPTPLIGSAFLAAMSSVAQERVKVLIPGRNRFQSPSLFLLVVAESGERKTSVDQLIFRPLIERDKQYEKKFKDADSEYASERTIWDQVHRKLVQQAAAAVLADRASEDLKSKLHAHEQAKPTSPRLRRRVRQDITDRALLDAVEGDGECISLICDDGEYLLSSPLFQKNALLNKAWSGTSISLDRANGVSITARDLRMTVCVMLQSSVLRTRLEKRGDSDRGSGFWARFLVTWPQSTQGTRYIQSADQSWLHLEAFHDVMRKLLEESDSVIEPMQINYELDDGAKAYWVSLVNEVESSIQPFGYMCDISDFASKACEITVRVAALFHHFEGQHSRISFDTLKRAASLVNFHINEFKKIFAPAPTIPQFELDAQKLDHYLQTKYQAGLQILAKNFVLNNGPVRTKKRFQPALDHLQFKGRVWIGRSANRCMYININPISPQHQTPNSLFT